MAKSSDANNADRLAALDHAHLWHPFTPMKQWREQRPLIIESGDGDMLVDTDGGRYIDGMSSLWCNIHGHRVGAIDNAIRRQLDKVAHSTLLGLSNIPAIELAAKLVSLAPGGLNKVFYSDSGATATEVAFKMAVGYWFHRGQPQRHVLLALDGAYHGDTAGAMSVGYSDVFHRAFRKLTFHAEFVAPATREDHLQPALRRMDAKLRELGDTCAAVVIEPVVQGAAGMLMQPAGYVRGVAELCKKHGTLLIADEVATGFGRTGAMFACKHDGVQPDIMALGKGLTGGYMPLAATLATDEIAAAFEGELHEMRTLYHGHTFTGNPLACAAALASLELFEQNNVIADVSRKARILAEQLKPLRVLPQVVEVRQRGLMIGIELASSVETTDTTDSGTALGDFGESPALQSGYLRRVGHDVCNACRNDGLLIRPLGNVVVLMPPLAISEVNLLRMGEIVVRRVREIGK